MSEIKTVYPFMLSTSYGCGGDETDAYVLASRPYTRGELREQRHLLDKGRVKSRLESQFRIPAPPVWSAAFSTRSKFNSAVAARARLIKKRDEEVASMLDDAYLRAFHDLGMTPVSLEDYPPSGLFLDVNIDQGCRCSYSHQGPPAPADTLTPRAHLLTHDGTSYLLDASLDPDHALGVILGLDGVVDAQLAQYEVDSAPVRSFVELSKEEEGELSFVEWESYDQRRKGATSFASRGMRMSLDEKRSELQEVHLERMGVVLVTLDSFKTEDSGW